MDYSYNYGFLRAFMESHKLAKKDLLEALGCSDYVSLNKWLDGRVPVHVTAMLRFCNYYNIPMDGFFFDGDGLPVSIRPTLPDADSQTLPTDGYGIKEGRGRGIVKTHIGERNVSSHAQATAVAEGLARQTEQQRRRDETLARMQQDETREAVSRDIQDDEPPTGGGAYESAVSLTESILRLKLEHSIEIRRVEQDHHDREDRIRRDCQANFDAERNRLMDIIERQNNELSKLYAQTQKSNSTRYNYVAEEQPGD